MRRNPHSSSNLPCHFGEKAKMCANEFRRWLGLKLLSATSVNMHAIPHSRATQAEINQFYFGHPKFFDVTVIPPPPSSDLHSFFIYFHSRVCDRLRDTNGNLSTSFKRTFLRHAARRWAGRRVPRGTENFIRTHFCRAMIEVAGRLCRERAI